MRAALRVERSRDEVTALRAAFSFWLRRRCALDRDKRRYGSQLAALEKSVLACLGEIDAGLARVGPESPSADAYEACRRADVQAVFVWRLWGHYRERWDQRDDDELGPVLTAADELAWSCYAPAFDQPPPAPLPHIVADYGAYAVARHDRPRELCTSDRLLLRAVEELPVPTVGLPRVCVARPWWLLAIAHEAGHLVHAALGLAAGFADLVGSAAVSHEEDWRRWSSEAFADAFAVATIGAAHLWLLEELQHGDDASLLRAAHPAYPPPLVRQALAAQVLAGLGLAATSGVPPVAPPALKSLAAQEDDRVRAAELLKSVPAVAAGIVGTPLAGEARLAELSGWSVESLATNGDGAGWWRDQFNAERGPSPQATLEAARLAAAGALGAWAGSEAEPGTDARREQRDTLRRRMLAVLPECREPGYRAPAAPTVDVDGLARSLAAEMRRLPVEEWA